jgi:aminoglycoside phosphotransferase (APT) family kinase protein
VIPPDVPPICVTSFVEGVSFQPCSRAVEADVDIVAERMRNAARTMAALHALDPDALGLAGGAGRRTGDEVDRWRRLPEDETLIRIPRERRLAVLRASRDWFGAM